MKRKIGVLDSGIGGLTTAKALQGLLPNEDIVYFGDNKNVPYGNKTEEEIKLLTSEILKFMESKDVKVVALACNTISTLVDDEMKAKFDYKIIDIVRPTVDYIKDLGVDSLGVIATEVTIKSNMYQRLLRDQDYEVIGEPSKDLAAQVDKGLFDSQEIRDTIKTHMDNIFKRQAINNLVLGCTHYPIVEDIFKEISPQVNYINPGYQQAKAVKAYLQENNLLNSQDKGSIEIITSGDIDIYEKVVEKLEIVNVKGISRVQLI